MLCVAIIVVAIPEGLPLPVTLSLAFAISKMKKQKNLVKSMTSCETLGSANFACTDKTRTLRQNLMKIEKFCNLDDNKRIEDYSVRLNKDPKLSLHQNHSDYEYEKIMEQAIAINISNGYKIKDGKSELPKDCNPTDKSLYDLFQERLKFDFSETQDKYFVVRQNLKIIHFRSETTFKTTLIKHLSFAINGLRVFLKGEADVALPKENQIYI